jgi:hypothetical protein
VSGTAGGAQLLVAATGCTFCRGSTCIVDALTAARQRGAGRRVTCSIRRPTASMNDGNYSAAHSYRCAAPCGSRWACPLLVTIICGAPVRVPPGQPSTHLICGHSQSIRLLGVASPTCRCRQQALTHYINLHRCQGGIVPSVEHSCFCSWGSQAGLGGQLRTLLWHVVSDICARCLDK